MEMNSPKGFEITKIEQLMSSSMKPVNPRPEFVNQLHQRLTDPLTPSIRYPREYSLRFILLLIASLLSGIVFIITITQVIISLIKEIRIARPVRGQSGFKLD
jgi:hypothetical protein